jgi:hypothetical protein
MNTPPDSSLVQYLLGAVAALAGCVGVLFAWFRSNFKAVEDKLNDCEADRQKLWAKIAEILSGRKTTVETLSLRKTKE